MRLLSWWTLGIFGIATAAFQDAAPFLALSTSNSLNITDSRRSELLAASYDSIAARLKKALNRCSTNAYIFVSIPGATDDDLTAANSMPYLRWRMQALKAATGDSVTVKNLVGSVDLISMQDNLLSRCSATLHSLDPNAMNSILDLPASDDNIQVIRVELPALPASAGERVARLRHHDAFLEKLINTFDFTSYTVLVAATPADLEVQWQLPDVQSEHAVVAYQMDETYPTDVYKDLKRDVSAHLAPRTTQPGVGLFEKYSFLNSGVFMGILVGLLLLTILYVAISAVSSVEVSYMAFSKEMGPAAQKKQQ